MRDPYRHLAGVYDEIVVDPCHASWADHLERAWQADPVHRVLDLCCGSGLMTAELLARGHEVVGVDASAAMLVRARALLGPGVPLIEALLPDLPVAGPFDAVVSTLDGLNYLPLPAFEQTLHETARILRPRGWLAFDLHAESILDFLAENPVIEGSDDTATWTLTTVIEGRTCRTAIDLRAMDPTASFVEEHVQHVHSAAEVSAALAAAGFEIVAVTDEYSDSPVDEATLRVAWLARRAA